MSQELIKKAKYKVKNGDGKYELIYLETSAEQVIESEEKQFVTAAEKVSFADKYTVNEIDQKFSDANAQILALQEKDTELDGKIEANTALIGSNKEAVDAAIGEVNTAVEAVNTALGEYKTANDAEVEALKSGKAEAVHKHEIADVTGLQDALDLKETIVGAEEKIATALEEAKGYADEKVVEINGSIDAVTTEVEELTGRVTTNESDIASIKETLSNKNSNTVVVKTVSEIATANANPKVGDLAFVLDIKKSFIYQGADAVTVEVPGLPTGWIHFDEISTEIDLVSYLKKEEAASTYRRLDTKIVEDDLDGALATKINDKADKTYVDDELATKANKEEVYTKEEVFTKEEVKAKLAEQAVSVGSEEPVETQIGHVWLELI